VIYFCKGTVNTKRAVNSPNTHQDDTVESLLEPRHCVVLLHPMPKSNSGLLLLSLCNPCPRSPHNYIEVHPEDTDPRVISRTQIDMFLYPKAKVACLGEVSTTKLVFFDFEATLQNLLGFGPTNRYVYSDFLVTTNTEGTDGVAGFRGDGCLSCQLFQNF
jgi:hypothetical protein